MIDSTSLTTAIATSNVRQLRNICKEHKELFDGYSPITKKGKEVLMAWMVNKVTTKQISALATEQKQAFIDTPEEPAEVVQVSATVAEVLDREFDPPSLGQSEVELIKTPQTVTDVDTEQGVFIKKKTFDRGRGSEGQVRSRKSEVGSEEKTNSSVALEVLEVAEPVIKAEDSGAALTCDLPTDLWVEVSNSESPVLAAELGLLETMYLLPAGKPNQFTIHNSQVTVEDPEINCELRTANCELTPTPSLSASEKNLIKTPKNVVEEVFIKQESTRNGVFINKKQSALREGGSEQVKSQKSQVTSPDIKSQAYPASSCTTTADVKQTHKQKTNGAANLGIKATCKGLMLFCKGFAEGLSASGRERMKAAKEFPFNA